MTGCDCSKVSNGGRSSDTIANDKKTLRLAAVIGLRSAIAKNHNYDHGLCGWRQLKFHSGAIPALPASVVDMPLVDGYKRQAPTRFRAIGQQSSTGAVGTAHMAGFR